jgi:hypothetical protein
MTRVRPREDLPRSAGKSDFDFSVQTWRSDLNGDTGVSPGRTRRDKDPEPAAFPYSIWPLGGPTPTPPTSGDAAARIFLPQLVDFDLSFLSLFRSDFFNFRFKKKLVYFSSMYINCLRRSWSGCTAKSAVAVSR